MPSTRNTHFVALCALLLLRSSQGGLVDGIWRRLNRDDAVKPGHVVKPENGSADVGQAMSVHEDRVVGSQQDLPKVSLSNGLEMPLLGMGVGKLEDDLLEHNVFEAMKSVHGVYLFDTSSHSNNEALLARAIATEIQESENATQKVPVHVVTKVWYTHLGYDRTKMSVQASMEALNAAILDSHIDLKVHVLIHWPRCYDSISWMHCEVEEYELPEVVRKAGPAPHLNKVNSWKGSWQALEDMYRSGEYPLASIGVSNFGRDDLSSLMKMARVKPHIVQTSIWSLLRDPGMVQLSHLNNVHLQVYNVTRTIEENKDVSPHAYHHLHWIANELTYEAAVMEGPDGHVHPIAPSQVVVKWLAQHDIGVNSQSSTPEHLSLNSAVAISRIPQMSEEMMDVVAEALEALVSGKDMEDDVHVQVVFRAENSDAYISWYQDDDNEVAVAYLKVGETFEEFTHPDHVFRVYDSDDPEEFKEYIVDGAYGDVHEVIF